ncbi:MAG: ABC transporter ATP-binding protein [Spirochaetales bacterium]|nr:ABC transporter ATP-binding protein [Spirochaetales bacterium]
MKSVNIKLENLTKTYIHQLKGKISAVNGVSLEVEPGELLTLLGPSGCGKTTTMRMLAGFEEPDSGKVFIGSEDVTDQMANQRDIGFVFQNYALFPHLSVAENVAYGLKVRGVDRNEIGRRVDEALQLVKLEGYQEQFPHQMSGGEQQRVALARAIVIKPKVLLLDEPLSNLDAKLRISTRGEIRRLQKALSISTLYVTHDQEEAMAISDRIIVMNHGDIIQIGTAEELYYNPKTEFVAKFIGAINAIPSKIVSSSDEEAVADIEGEKFKVRNFRKNVKPGDSADVLLRPEAVRLKEVNPESKIKGTVVERAFLGDRVDYTVAAESFTIKVSLYDSFGQVTFKCDQEVEIILDEKRMKILER